jgi:hypothetical protein
MVEKEEVVITRQQGGKHVSTGTDNIFVIPFYL